MQGTYGYFDQGDGIVLTKRVGHNQGYLFYSEELVYLKGAKLLPVPRKYLAVRRAPSVLWKPDANPNVKNAIAVQMVDLQGSLGADAPAVPGTRNAACQDKVRPQLYIATGLEIAAPVSALAGIALMMFSRHKLAGGGLMAAGLASYVGGRWMDNHAADAYAACTAGAH